VQEGDIVELGGSVGYVTGLPQGNLRGVTVKWFDSPDQQFHAGCQSSINPECLRVVKCGLWKRVLAEYMQAEVDLEFIRSAKYWTQQKRLGLNPHINWDGFNKLTRLKIIC